MSTDVLQESLLLHVSHVIIGWIVGIDVVGMLVNKTLVRVHVGMRGIYRLLHTLYIQDSFLQPYVTIQNA